MRKDSSLRTLAAFGALFFHLIAFAPQVAAEPAQTAWEALVRENPDLDDDGTVESYTFNTTQ